MTLISVFIFLWSFLANELILEIKMLKTQCTEPFIRVDSGGLIQSHKQFSYDTYPNNLDCKWLIQAPSGFEIVVQFNFLNIEMDKQCNLDYVEFENLEEGNVRVCGTNDKDRYISHRNKLVIHFHSNNQTSLEGFTLRFWFVMASTDIIPLTKYGRTCVSNEWECKSDRSCIPKEWLCDRFRDCRDNSDETECVILRPCHQSQIQCNSGDCVQKEQWCNRRMDCYDGSDEMFCATANLPKEIRLNNCNCGFQPIKPKNVNITNDNPQIVGGQEAVPGSWPWMASLRFNSFHYCGATLISKSWALTAAHCFENDAQPKFWELDLGRHYINDDGYTQRIKISKVIVHPYYNSGTIENDIALIKLSINATLSSRVQTLCIPDLNEEPHSRQRCVILGWGTTQGTGGVGVLKQAVVPIVERGKCNNIYKNILDGMVCAGYDEGGVDTCQEDSGGPLICSKNDTLALYGITSWGEGCALPQRPGVYTNVAKYIKWINMHVKDFQNCGF